MKKTFTQSAILGLSHLLGRVLFLMFLYFMNSLVDTTELRWYANVYIPYSLIADISSLGIFIGTSRMVSTSKEEEKTSILRKGTLLSLLLGFFFCLISLTLAKRFISLSFGEYSETYLISWQIASFSIIMYPLLNFYRGFFQGLLKTSIFGLSIVFEQSIKFALLMVIIVFHNRIDLVEGNIVNYLLLTTFFGTIITTLFMFVFMFKKYFRPKSNYNYLFKHFTIGVPFGITTLFYTLFQVVDSTFFSRLASVGEVAKYSTIYLFEGARLIYIPIVLAQAIGTTLMPRLANNNSPTSQEGIKKIISFSLSFLVVMTLGFMFFSRDIYDFVFGNDSSGGMVLADMAILIYVFGLYKILLGVALAKGKIAFLVWASILSVLTKVYLNQELISVLGYKGAMVSSLVAISIGIFAVLIVLNKYLGGLGGLIIRETFFTVLIASGAFVFTMAIRLLLGSNDYFKTIPGIEALIFILLYIFNFLLIKTIKLIGTMEKTAFPRQISKP